MPPITKQNRTAQAGLAMRNDPQFQFRERIPVASIGLVAAPYTVLPAVPGYKYRISDMSLIAIGANAGAVTDVRISGTRAAAIVDLLTVLLAGLTRSTVNYVGVANVSVLADGASFTELDINTPVIVYRTGAAITGATAIDCALEYSLVKA